MSDGQLQAYKEMLEKRGSGGAASESLVSKTKSIAANGKTYIFPLDATKDEIQKIVGLGAAWADVPNGDWQDIAKSDDWKVWREAIARIARLMNATRATTGR
jgi:hypothetical protein